MTSTPTNAIGILLLAFGIGACNAAATPLKLSSKNAGARFHQISMTATGDLCLVGRTLDPEGDLRTRGVVMLARVADSQVLWQQTVEAPDDAANNRFIACRSDGQFTYVAANVETHSQRSMSKSLAYVYKFDAKGKLISTKEVVSGSEHAFIYDMHLDGKTVSVVGMALDTAGATEKYAIYFAKLDENLMATTFSKLPTGAFAPDAKAALSANAVQLAGNFFPADVAKDDLISDYAVSRIVNGKYQFSVRPQTARPDEVATAISAQGDVASVSFGGKVSTLTVVNQAGKSAPRVALDTALCDVGALSAEAEVVYAVGKACGKLHAPRQLFAIGRRTGSVRVLAALIGTPVMTYPAAGNLYVVAEQPNKAGLSLQSLPLGGR